MKRCIFERFWETSEILGAIQECPKCSKCNFRDFFLRVFKTYSTHLGDMAVNILLILRKRTLMRNVFLQKGN